MKTKMLCVWLCVLAISASVIGCTSSSDINSGVTDRPILYKSKRALDGANAWNSPYANFNIWTVNFDTGYGEPLTQSSAVEDAHSDSPRWSPDNSKVIFASRIPPDGGSTANDGYNIWVMESDGSSQQALTTTSATGVTNLHPEWSPDGTKIVFDSNRALDGSDALNTNGKYNIWVVNSSGTGLTALTQETDVGADLLYPQWSPDGTKIAFAWWQIFVMDSDGGNVTSLSSGHSQNPQWSPDGTKIVFQSSTDGTTVSPDNIWVVDADGGNLTALTELTVVGANSEFPQWSPDGTKIGFFSQRALDGSDAANTNGTQNIWAVNADGTGAAALTELTAADANSFQPYYSSGRFVDSLCVESFPDRFCRCHERPRNLQRMDNGIRRLECKSADHHGWRRSLKVCDMVKSQPNTYAVILAGGEGTRFYPLSTPERPKQFLKLIGDGTFIQQTRERISPLVKDEHLFVSTNERYRSLVEEQLPSVPSQSIIAEPFKRNTAPALAYAARLIYQMDPEAVICCFPSDHHIEDVDGFRKVLEKAIRLACDGYLVTLGMKPTSPSPEYGYIRPRDDGSGQSSRALQKSRIPKRPVDI